MNILITGGAGFIGSHLAEACLRRGWSVSIIDDLSTGSFQNIAHLKNTPGFSYTIDTVFNAHIVAELVDCADAVFHLAAAVGVRLIVDSPVRTIETNVHGTEVVLRAAAKKRKPIIVASTSEVYGKTVETPFREEGDLLLGPATKGRWSYACSKAIDEFLAIAYYNELKLPATVVRLFNTVGPRQTAQYGMVLPTFVQQALADAPITVYGDGRQSRCFGYVGDVVEVLVRMIGAPRIAGEIFNIGNDREISIRGLAQLIKERTGSSSEIVHVPYDQVYGPGFEDMYRRIPSLDKLERAIGMRPTTPLETIIDSVVASYRGETLRRSGVAA